MTTLAIIGSGIAGRSLLYALAKEKKSIEKITLVSSDKFTSPCTLSSTAIVAPRGLSTGHSPLGDLLLEGYKEFSEHVTLEQPEGVEIVPQYTGASEKLDAFQLRYPHGKIQKLFLNKETYIAEDRAFMVNPEIYSEWLLNESKILLENHLEIIQDLVTNVEQEERVHIKTQNGRTISFDKVIFTAGTYNRFWKDLGPESVLKTSKPVQGSYLEFKNVSLMVPSFSMSLDGDNLVWSEKNKTLLIGSTTQEAYHVLPPYVELQAIYERLVNAVNLKLPDYSQGEIKVGLREKAKKREPYIIQEGHLLFFGGLYKNGFTLSLKMSRNLSHQYL